MFKLLDVLLHRIVDRGALLDRIRKDHAPANFATIKHIASNLMRRVAGKKSMRVKRRLAAWDDAYLASLIQAA